LAKNDFKTIALKTPHGLIASGFGSGLGPIAPGTWGSALACIVWWPLAMLSLWMQLGIIIAGFLLGVWASNRTSDDLGVHDFGGIVWDEFIGMWITLLFCPQSIFWYAVAFFVFRVFDVVKPPPIGWLDRQVDGGFGIMVDDVLAGIYSLGLMQLLLYWVPDFL